MTFPTALKLGTLELSSPFIVSPMESVSDCAYRHLAWSCGAAFTWTEMIRARGVVRSNTSTIDLIDTFDADVPTGLQLFVVNETELQEALDVIEKLAETTHPHFRNIRAVDLNFGCPSPNVIRVGAGPALLKRRSKMRAILETLSAWKKKTALPIGAVGAKIRLGMNRFEQDQKVYLPFVDIANETIDYVVVHGRHARQQSNERATWSAIGEVKAKATIPVIGNGDITSRADAEKLHKLTGCDGFMLARAAIRSPWVFRELTQRGAAAPTSAEIADAQRQYDARATELKSKEKFRTWHNESFARMRARLAGKNEPSSLPKNEHMK